MCACWYGYRTTTVTVIIMLCVYALELLSSSLSCWGVHIVHHRCSHHHRCDVLGGKCVPLQSLRISPFPVSVVVVVAVTVTVHDATRYMFIVAIFGVLCVITVVVTTIVVMTTAALITPQWQWQRWKARADDDTTHTPHGVPCNDQMLSSCNVAA